MAVEEPVSAADSGAETAVDTHSRGIWAALRPRVVAAVRRTCPYWLVDQADDLVQTVLVQLMRTLRKSEDGRAFSTTYLQKAAYGAVVDEMRRQCRRHEQGGDTDSLDRRAATKEASPEVHAASEQIAREIHDCLLRLVRPRRQAVGLYLQGCGIMETARRLHWSAKRTEHLIYGGIVELRRCLERKGITP